MTDLRDAPADALAVARAYLVALGGDDPDAVADLVADDFVNEHQNALGSGCVGRATYRERLPGFFAAFPRRRYDLVEIAVGAPDVEGEVAVVVRYRFRAEIVRDDRTVEIDIPGVMWIGAVDGMVTRRIDTWDALTYFDQSGESPPGFVPAGRASDGT